MDSQATRPVVLVVDDEPMIHTIVARTVESAGWEVLTALDGLEAIELLGRVRIAPNLVITDMRMPRMGGAELGKWVESQYPTLPILYISGFVDKLPVMTGHRSTGLGKPFTPTVLLQTVQDLCSQTTTVGERPH